MITNALLVLSVAVFSSAYTFVPSSLTFVKGRHGTTSPKQHGVLATSLSMAISQAAGLLNELEKIDDFDPNEDNNHEKTRRLLDITIKGLELIEGNGVTTAPHVDPISTITTTSELEKEELVKEVISKVGSQARVSRRPVLTHTDGEVEEETEHVEVKEKKDGRQSTFGGILTLLREFQKQYAKREAIGYTTYPAIQR